MGPFHIVVLLTTLLLATRCQEQNDVTWPMARSASRVIRSASKGSNSEFEKFFLKASKSVPRIGRRNGVLYMDDSAPTEEFLKRLNWNDIAYLYEYKPELFASNDPGNNFQLNSMDYNGLSHSPNFNMRNEQ
ncbi:hypothetical protein ABEB36_007940 [Hypothenemus hampei]|uniref:Uncharacterized protein n=1 Tax=Hypothenemus hampei TaxID=57062 RepID=A0ABD1EVM4_HYPHA